MAKKKVQEQPQFYSYEQIETFMNNTQPGEQIYDIHKFNTDYSECIKCLESFDFIIYKITLFNEKELKQKTIYLTTNLDNIILFLSHDTDIFLTSLNTIISLLYSSRTV